MGFRPLQKICCSHASKLVEIPSHHGNKQKQQRQVFQVFQKIHSPARISEKYSGAKFFREQTPKIQAKAKNRENCKSSGFFGPQNLPNKKLGPLVPHHHHRSGVGLVGGSHSTGRAETKHPVFLGNTIHSLKLT